MAIFTHLLFIHEAREWDGQIVGLWQKFVMEATLKLIIIKDELIPLLFKVPRIFIEST